MIDSQDNVFLNKTEERLRIFVLLRSLIIFKIVCILTACTFAGTVEAKNSQLTMEFKVLYSEEKGYPVQIALTNKGGTPISLETLDLPWIPFNAHILFVSAKRMEQKWIELVKGGPLEIWVPSTKILNPGKSISGEIVLSHIFPTLLQDVRQSEILINWECKMRNTVVFCPQGKKGVFKIYHKKVDSRD